MSWAAGRRGGAEGTGGAGYAEGTGAVGLPVRKRAVPGAADGQGGGGQGGGSDRDGAGQPLGATDVTGFGRAAVPEFGPVLGDASVGADPAQPQAESAGEGGLRAAGVRARVPAAVPEGGAQRGAGTSAGQRRADRGETRRQPRGRPVGHVVEAGRRPAEPLVPRGPVADHRVQGVHRAVGGQAGQPGERGPDQRADRRVAGVLGHGLHHGAGDVLRPELRGVPAAEPRKDRPGRFQIIRVQRDGGPFGFPGQRTGTGDRPDEGRGRGTAQQRPVPGEPVRGHRGEGGGQDAGAGEERAAEPVIRVETRFQCRGAPAEDGHRVPAARVADQRVQRHARGQAARQCPVPPPRPCHSTRP